MDHISNLKAHYNQKMISKRVFVVCFGGYYATVVDANEDSFIVKPDKGNERVVSMFDVRSVD